MEEVLKLIIITPHKEFYNGEIKELNTETMKGHIGILPNHLPMITVLKPTITIFRDKDGKEFKAFTSSGMMEVENNNIKMLCDACEWDKDIDSKRAEEAKKRAEERLSKKEKDIDIKRAKMALERSITRLKVENII